MDQGDDCSRNYVPVVSDLKWNYRLDIQDVLNAAVRPHTKVAIVLKGYGNELCHRVLHLLR
jgi:hypothetical protein